MEIKIGPDAITDIELLDDNGVQIPATEVDIKIRVDNYPEIRLVLQEHHIMFYNDKGEPLEVGGIKLTKNTLNEIELKGEVRGS